MQTVLATFVERHDLRLAALAVLICGLSAFAGITLVNHARRARGRTQKAWLAIAVTAVGFGIWATHFVAMLSFAAGMPTGYDLPMTLASLGIAMAIVGGGLWFATIGQRRSDALLGGAIVGVGIAAMHYVGMAALLLGGRIAWDGWLVAASLLIGMGLGAAALYIGIERPTLRWRLGGAALLTLAISGMHFTAMGAAGLAECYPIVTAADQTPEWLSIVVAAVSMLILLMALAGSSLDLHEQRRAAAEAQRMRGLADAAVEGLIVCRDDVIVTANLSFLDLVALPHAEVMGMKLSEFLSPTICTALGGRPNSAMETELRTGAGAALPVEVILRRVDFDGMPHEAIAIRDLSARKQAERHIRYLAHHDPLTGLPNRARFSRELEDEIVHARRHAQVLAVLCVDLDRFKEVNDLFGHPAGDALLQRVGQALQQTVGNAGSAARLGGDEFAIVLTDIGSPGRAGRLADALLEAFRRDNDLVTTGPIVSASIGIALFPENAGSAEQLMSQADTALYRAKQEGRGTYRFYRTEMGAEVRDRRILEHELRQALANKQLRLVYQPQIDLQSGEVTGFEALIRWDHPRRGPVSPGLFIPIAEESGLILAIGEWALRTAAAEAASWAVPLTIAVNVSAVQVHAPAFTHTVQDVLARSGLSPGRLEIEITETALIRDMARAVATLRQIRSLGVHIAMDDFGTGYSSLANLRAFPFSKLKVDQSFIRSVDRNEQSAAIVRAVLGLGAGLNIPVVAEGVERVEELEFLKGAVCETVQGYLFSRPEPISQFLAITEGRASRLDAAPKPLLRAVG